jgi:hypothetical protein
MRHSLQREVATARTEKRGAASSRLSYCNVPNAVDGDGVGAIVVEQWWLG